MKHCRLFLVIILVLFLFPGQVLSITPQLKKYVRKYHSITIPKEQLVRVTTYNYLIEYFSSFSFFQPNHKVSTDFVKALIIAESGANPNAVSAKKAKGLGQIIYTTGKRAAEELYATGIQFRYIHPSKLRHLQEKDLFDPAINILITCYLISKYNFRFNGKLDLVVSAWNAGEHVDSLKIGLPAPYTETYNLIGKVNGYFIYLLKMREK